MMSDAKQHNLSLQLSRLRLFLVHVLRRFRDDGCLAAAGALSYTTLVSLVPLVAISLAVLSAFPIFDTLRSQLLGFVFDAFVPSIGGTVEQYISAFAATAGRTTAVGLIVLAVTSILLLATIEDRLGQIWRVNAPRRWSVRITVYWTILTLGPVLFGLAFSLSGTLGAVSEALGFSNVSEHVIGRGLRDLSVVVPMALEALGLTLFYCLIPHCPVRWRDGLLGGVVASVLLEICKGGFTIFIGHYNSYEAIYGALAVIPIFLLWMYLSWGVVLFGAEIAAAVPLWGLDEALADGAEVTDLDLALQLLEALSAQTRQGGTARLRWLARSVKAPIGTVGRCLDLMVGAGIVAATVDGGFVLARDLGAVSLLDLQSALDSDLPGRRRRSGRHRLDQRLTDVRRAEIDALSVPVASVLEDGDRHPASMSSS
ncbi:MAG TPA: YihY family inner membrane protein [Aliidongia sp.]|nr:YihY family inner membrane protein [Aliidongia sp.]